MFKWFLTTFSLGAPENKPGAAPDFQYGTPSRRKKYTVLTAWEVVHLNFRTIFPTNFG